MRTVAEIIKDAGGAKAIADRSAGALQRDAVYKWTSIGIPDRHWTLLIELAGSNPAELYEANLGARTIAPSEAAE
ncbi:carph-isopro domain-containing protein [Aliihoeflea sp. 40Bstr573]|uniref:carph-isopro domain-containing protein n=1 Tax=Aliihoeflea sp. 40Bstr573 TaxID=2696467 RepID=UPI0020959C18|nr:hypothetical protein [Aliihoeflea sp. 40Bstr573]MCO6386374.1 hypothetical protein [Aliihoeflea sp. 40Bstr573]